MGSAKLSITMAASSAQYFPAVLSVSGVAKTVPFIDHLGYDFLHYKWAVGGNGRNLRLCLSEKAKTPARW